MRPVQFDDELRTIYESAVHLARAFDVDGIVLMLDGPTDWEAVKANANGVHIVVAADSEEELEGAAAAGLDAVVVEPSESPVNEKLSQALVKAVSEEILAPGADVIAVYSLFEPLELDSVSLIHLRDHLGRLTVRDLRRLETSVPLDTLQTVVNLAIEIGREGREGKPVGTLFVVGDTQRVRRMSHTASFDPVKGYGRKERNLKSAKVREGIKEIAQMDGAILVAPDGTVEAAAQYIDASAADVTLSKGLGARHWAAAAISRATKAVAVAVSETSGTVRVFHKGEVVLRLEPFRRPLKWKEKDFDGDAAAAG
jgi:DNA integrity scanning protein DisA with diadenylate cyclase activity